MKLMFRLIIMCNTVGIRDESVQKAELFFIDDHPSKNLGIILGTFQNSQICYLQSTSRRPHYQERGLYTESIANGTTPASDQPLRSLETYKDAQLVLGIRRGEGYRCSTISLLMIYTLYHPPRHFVLDVGGSANVTKCHGNTTSVHCISSGACSFIILGASAYYELIPSQLAMASCPSNTKSEAQSCYNQRFYSEYPS